MAVGLAVTLFSNKQFPPQHFTLLKHQTRQRVSARQRSEKAP